jgi:hypothetical protein
MKLKLGLVPGFFIKALAVPFMLGEAKYARGDWANQADPEKFCLDRLDSAMRHATDYLDGVTYDEDGQNNAAAAAWNFLVVLYYRATRVKTEGLIDEGRYFGRYAELREIKRSKPAPQVAGGPCGHPPTMCCPKCDRRGPVDTF